MTHHKRATLAALLTLALLPAFAEEPRPPEVSIANSEARSITSKIVVGQTYGVWVLLPADYYSTTKSYPVLYVLGGWNFPLMASLADSSPYSRKLPPMIIVTLSYGRKDSMALGKRDFTPTKVAGEPMSGGADKFLAFMERELIPYIDRTYRTDPGDRGLIGHSYGGLFAFYALLNRPALFEHIVAASPSLYWDNGVILAQAVQVLPHVAYRTRIDFSFGSEEDDLGGVDAFFSRVDTIRPLGLDYRYTVYPGKNHDSVPPVSFSGGLEWVYRGWEQ